MAAAALTQRIPDHAAKTAQAEKWTPPASEETLRRVLERLRVYEPDRPLISLASVYESLEAVLAEGACPSGPAVQGLIEQMTGHLRELLPVLEQKHEVWPGVGDREAVARGRALLGQELPVTMARSRELLDGLALATQAVLYRLVEATEAEGIVR